ncbi:DUF305 domain-containing protein [Streptomyces sp. JH34]|uniref:DUF305 domain-containing protein n=1 Tax=Streptomyces sp. JH34 TaxID=2793633 RepID=UPI0023F9FC19|nr:DUF305 domain-containing protein [Streptomyces sp. JH34]MDF6021504.1 DUF305 domain-containing protein [Streptomyces sp. JH34]
MSAALSRRARWAVGSAVALAVLFAGAATVASARGDAAASAPLTPAADSADAGFARDMAVHHQQAVEMAFVVRDVTDDEDVRRLAYDIAHTQANQRGMLLGWLDLWELPKTAPEGQGPMAWMPKDAHSGHAMHDMKGAGGAENMDGTAEMDRDGALMPGMATRTELAELRGARGKQAEILFLQLMTDHHEGGVAMARGCAERCAVPVEKRLAQGMVEAQQSELDLMADMLAARGAAPRP